MSRDIDTFLREKNIVQAVETAVSQAGNSPALLGFDANGIQALVTASTRPLGMAGASIALLQFDEEQAKENCTIFAGGGRGLMVVPKNEAEERARELRKSFFLRTHGGVLATAHIGLPDRSKEKESLKLLRIKLGMAKDGAHPPKAEPAVRHRCPDCRVRPADTQTYAGDNRYDSCWRCSEFNELARSAIKANNRQSVLRKENLSLVDIHEEGKVAIVSADGNRLGVFFGALDTLAAVAAGSLAVAEIIRRAHEEALVQSVGSNHQHRFVAPVTGGDDIRVFLPPTALLTYLKVLFERVQAEAQTVGTLDGAAKVLGRLKSLRLGAGALVAPSHYPAARLIDATHALEKAAKKYCSEVEEDVSAVQLAFITTGDSLTDARSGTRGLGELKAEVVADRDLDKTRTAADLLRKVPRSQVGVALRTSDLKPAELANLFRYQVARHPTWQRWFDEVTEPGAWRDKSTCHPDKVTQPHLDMYRILRIGGRSTNE